MAKQIVNIGTNANDGNGDLLRNAFDKINDNFVEIYNAFGDGDSLTVTEDGDGNLDIANNLNVAGNASVTGNTSLTGSLTVTGSTILNSETITIGDSTDGSTTVNGGSFTVNPNSTFAGTLGVTGATTMNGSLTVVGSALFSNSQVRAQAAGVSLRVDNDLQVDGDIIVSGTVDGVDISALDSNVVKLTGNQTIAGNKTFSDNVTISEDLTVLRQTRFSRALTIESGGLEIQEDDLSVSNGNIVVSGTVDGVDISALPAASNIVTISGSQTISGAKTFSSDLTVNGNISVTGTVDGVDVSNLPSYDNIVTLDTDQTITGNKTFSGNLTTTGSLTDLGTTQIGSATIVGDLAVDIDTLYVDASEDAVGIGTDSPDLMLHLSHSGSNNGLLLQNTNNVNNYQILQNIRENEGLIWQRWIDGTFNANLMTLGYDGHLTIPNGSLGIGISTTPSEKLEVDGRIMADTHFMSSDTNATLSAQDGGNVFLRPNGFSNTLGQVVVKSTGNLGIGTDSPQTKIQVDSASNFSMALSKRANTTSAIKFTLSDPTVTASTWKLEHDGGENLNLFGYSADDLIISTNSTERMRIDSDGDVTIPNGSLGIGMSTTPDAKLEVQNAGDVSIRLNDSTTNYWDLTNDSNLIFSRGGTERMRIDSNGNVGIGDLGFTSLNAAYDRMIHIHSTLGSLIKLTEDGSGSGVNDGTDLILYSLDFYIHNRENGNILFYNSGSESMRIDSSGNVTIPNGKLGVGMSTTPDTNLHVFAASPNNVPVKFESEASTCFMHFVDTNTTADFKVRIGSSGDNLLMYAGGSERMRIDSSGNVGIGTGSDIDAKFHINGGTTADTAKVIVGGNDAIIRLGDNQAGGPHGLQFDGEGANDGMSMYYRTSPEYIVFEDSTGVGGSSIMTIGRDGNVGIGSTSPSGKIEVNTGGSAAYFTRTSGDDGALAPVVGIATDSARGLLAASGDSLDFRVRPVGTSNPFGGTTAMRIESSGDINFQNTVYFKNASTSDSGYDTILFSDNDPLGHPSGELLFQKTNPNIASEFPIGQISGRIGTSKNEVARIQLYGNSNDLFERDGDVRFYTSENGTLSERMRIDSSGNVGIGTGSDPVDSLLHLKSASSPTLRIEDTTNSVKGIFYAQNSNAALGTFSNHALKIITNNTPRISVLTNGRVLIGTETEIGTIDEKLQIKNNNGGARGIAIGNSDGSSATGTITFYNSNGVVGSIITSGSSTSYSTSSDHRLKENVTDLTGALDRLDDLNVKRFNFIADDSTTVDGFLAHEVQTVVPEAVTGTHNEVDDDGNPVYQEIDQSKLVPLLTAALQEAHTLIKDLTTRIETLEN